MTEYCTYPALEQGSAEWLRARADCLLTASELGTALGFGYESRAKLLRRKLGQEPPIEDNYYMTFGRDNEDRVAQAYDDVFNCQSVTHGFSTLTHNNITVGASPDRVVHGNPLRLVEIKCAFGDNPRDFVPPCHRAQMLMQTKCMNLTPIVDYACWSVNNVTADNKIKLFVARCSFDDRLWDNYVWPGIEEFAVMKERRITPMVNSRDKKRLLDAFERYTKVEVPQLN